MFATEPRHAEPIGHEESARDLFKDAVTVGLR